MWVSRLFITTLAASAALFVGFAAKASAQPATDTLVGARADWRYNDSGQDLGRAWQALSFDLTLRGVYRPSSRLVSHEPVHALASGSHPPPLASSRGFTIIVLPDTQKYVKKAKYAPIFTQQTHWIVSQRDALNIVFVSHAGDVCDSHKSVSQHANAANSLRLLDGKVPYGLCPGNHDQPTKLFNTYWPPSRFTRHAWYGGHHPADSNANSYQTFSGGGFSFVILHLEFDPDDNVIAWADQVLKAHSRHKAIITTHGFLDLDGRRDVHVMGSTQPIWNDLVVPNDNVYFVLCGHVHGEFHRTDTVNGRQVHQLLADYQDYPKGGEGWLRIMRFAPAENRVYVRTYSPYLDRYQTDADSQFTLQFP